MTEKSLLVSGVLPCPVVVLTTAAAGRSDAMTATAFFVSEDPPLLSVSVAQHHLTHELIELTGEFVVNLAAREQVEMVKQLGSVQGRDTDKLEMFDVTTIPGEKVGAARLEGCYASLECRVVTKRQEAGYQVYTAEVVAHEMDAERSPLIWHQGRYYGLGPPVGPAGTHTAT